jgi:acyl carrier protein
VPAQFVVLPALPLTPNGKVDRSSLPDPDHAARCQDDYVPPNNELEMKLCGLWQSMLKRERVGIHDDFFAHGGDSLLLVKLASLIEGEFGLSVNLQLLFANPTIEGQGRMLAQQLELSQLLQAVGKVGEARTQNYFVL